MAAVGEELPGALSDPPESVPGDVQLDVAVGDGAAPRVPAVLALCAEVVEEVLDAGGGGLRSQEDQEEGGAGKEEELHGRWVVLTVLESGWKQCAILFLLYVEG